MTALIAHVSRPVRRVSRSRVLCVASSCRLCWVLVPSGQESVAHGPATYRAPGRDTPDMGARHAAYGSATHQGEESGYGVPVPKTRIDAVKPCRWLRPPTGPISPAAKNPATPVVSSPERTASTS